MNAQNISSAGLLSKVWIGTPPIIVVLVLVVVLYDVLVFRRQAASIKAKQDSTQQTLKQISDGIALMISAINKIIDDAGLAIPHIEPLEEYQTI